MTTSITGPSADRRPARLAGFTLLELVLVMVIICTVLGMAAPSLRGFFASRQTVDAGAQIVALTQYARTEAASEGRVYRLNLDAETGRYWLTAQTGGAFAPLSAEFGRVFCLPEGTTARWNSAGEAASSGWIPFYPDGRTEPADIRLTGRQGDTVQIVCASPAEQFRVVASAHGGEP